MYYEIKKPKSYFSVSAPPPPLFDPDSFPNPNVHFTTLLSVDTLLAVAQITIQDFHGSDFYRMPYDFQVCTYKLNKFQTEAFIKIMYTIHLIIYSCDAKISFFRQEYPILNFVNNRLPCLKSYKLKNLLDCFVF